MIEATWVALLVLAGAFPVAFLVGVGFRFGIAFVEEHVLQDKGR